MRYMFCMLMASVISLVSTAAYADDSRSLNFIILEKTKASFDYDPIIFGGFSKFIRAMDGAQVALLSHTASSRNGDVINLQQDILQESAAGEFDDVGVNCQLTFTYDGPADDVEYHIAGDCQIHGHFNGESMKLKAHVPTTDLADAAKTGDIWIEVYEDKKSGVAFYANASNH